MATSHKPRGRIKVDDELCALCEAVRWASKHHLIPQSQKGKVTVKLCDACHDTIHATITNKKLATTYNSIEKLLLHEKIKEFVVWRKAHPEARPTIKMTKGRRKRKRST